MCFFFFFVELVVAEASSAALVAGVAAVSVSFMAVLQVVVGHHKFIVGMF